MGSETESNQKRVEDAETITSPANKEGIRKRAVVSRDRPHRRPNARRPNKHVPHSLLRLSRIASPHALNHKPFNKLRSSDNRRSLSTTTKFGRLNPSNKYNGRRRGSANNECSERSKRPCPNGNNERHQPGNSNGVGLNGVVAGKDNRHGSKAVRGAGRRNIEPGHNAVAMADHISRKTSLLSLLEAFTSFGSTAAR